MLRSVFVLVTGFLKLYLLRENLSLHNYYTLKGKSSCVLIAGIKPGNLGIRLNVDKHRQVPKLVSFRDVFVFKSL